MTSSILKMLIFVLAAPVPCSWATGQSCPDQEGNAAVTRFVDSESKAGVPLYGEHLPDLNDALISLVTRGLTSPLNAEVPPINFYKVTPAGYQLRGNKVVGESVQLDNESEWIVAVDCQKDRKFLLEGSADPFASFNDLARDFHLRVADTETALSVFDFFLQVARGSRFRSGLVSDEMKLDSVALEDFRLRFPAAKRRAAFNEWRARIPAAVRRILAPPRVVALRSGFEVQYFSYIQGTVYSESLTVNTDGTVAQGNRKILLGTGPHKAR
jgi:hypothetical protein